MIEFPLPKTLTWKRRDGILEAWAEDYYCTIEKYTIGARLRIRRPRFYTVEIRGKQHKFQTKPIWEDGFATVADAKKRALNCIMFLNRSTNP